MNDPVTLRLSRYAMACEFEIIVSGGDRRYLVEVANCALDEIERLDRQLSVFNPTSEISYVNTEAARRPVVVEPRLFGLLQLAARIWAETGGSFDITAGPIIDLWRRAEAAREEPDGKAIEAALAKVGMSHVVLDERSNSVTFDTQGVTLDLGAIGKGHAVQQAANLLKEYNVTSGLVSGGGSTVYGLGEGPGARGWEVGIRHPSSLTERVETILLVDRAMSTSGGVEQRDAEADEKFEHIVDPITGAAVQPAAISASVIGEDAAECDALSTAFYALGRGFAEEYCRTHRKISAVLVERGAAEGEFAAVRVPGDAETGRTLSRYDFGGE